MESEEKIDKNIIKKIFKEHWEDFKKEYKSYDTEYYDEVINKMLICGEKEGGYATYQCANCLEEKTVAFSCKSCFCLSCGKVYVDNWVEYVSKNLYAGVYYRHIVLTVPEEQRQYFYRERQSGELLKELINCGVETLNDAVATYKKQKIKLGFIIVLQLVGRAGNYNPHLHILMTSGGINEKDEWIKLNYFPYEMLHKKWEYHLFTMLKEKVKEPGIKEAIDKAWKKYPNGLVAYWEKGEIPRDTEGLARYLAKYVVSPPIAIKRILEYDGEKVRYYYNDHKTGQREELTVDVLTFIGKLVQTILPKGFHRIRYRGIQATCILKKMTEKMAGLLKEVGEKIKGAYKVVRKSFRERIIESFKKDPFKCAKCGGIMKFVSIWHPKYGTIVAGR